MAKHESYWRTVARDVIDRALKEGRSEGLEGDDLLARVDAAYPFGERAMYPYKTWLDQRRKQCLSLLPERSRRGRPRPDEPRIEQLEADMARVAQGEITLAELARREELGIGERVFVVGGISVMRADHCWIGTYEWVQGKYSVKHNDAYLWPDLRWHAGTGRPPRNVRDDYPGYFDDLETLVDCLYNAEVPETAEVPGV